MSGSGKSDGEKITYGLKEQQDISTFLFIVGPVIDYLHKRRGINEFVIWGRSMGAVAALLYGINNLNLKNLRNSKLDPNGMLTATYFLKNGGKPTIAVFISRFGSWKNACNLAGVKTGEGRKSYNREHSKLELLAFVEQYLNDAESSGSALGYDKWQRNFPNAPSLALLRQRLGKWNDIKKQLSRFL
jgi:hypothetical protein